MDETDLQTQPIVAFVVMDPITDRQPDSDAVEELSLDALAAAFAEALGRPGGGQAEGSAASGAATSDGAAPTHSAAQSPAGASADESSAPVRRIDAPAPWDVADRAAADDAPPDDDAQVTPLSILEAMLFVGDRGGGSLAPQRAAELMRGVRSEEIPGLVDELNARYRRRGCPYEVTHVGAGYRMTLRPEFHALRDRFFGRVREARLSQAALDVLAIVAYQQPVTSETVSTLRGTPSHAILTQLVRRRLLRIERPPAPEAGSKPKRRSRKRVADRLSADAAVDKSSPTSEGDKSSEINASSQGSQGSQGQGQGRTVLYWTTDRFLQLFALESLDDLPQSEELDGQ